jgi:GNAT superfamily N-acetyltransferase
MSVASPEAGSMPEAILRLAEPGDADGIADVWLTAFAATYDFPAAHTDDEIRAWIRSDLLADTETWVAVDPDGSAVGFMSLTDDMLDQLYLRPEATGRGTGSRLIALAKAGRPTGLDLYTFQVNAGARRFYERHGFVPIWFGDGSANEERQPDVRYHWAPGS